MANYRRYEPELKEKVLRLHLEEGRTKKSLTQEYNLGSGTLTYWLKQRREECKTGYSGSKVHTFLKFRAPLSGEAVHAFPEVSAVN